MAAKRIFLHPLDTVSGGSGHMRRCLDLAQNLGSTAVLLTSNAHKWQISRFFPHVSMMDIETAVNMPPISDSLLVFDRRKVSIQELGRLVSLGTPVLLDDDGPVRSFAPMVVDTIPGPRRNAPNLLQTAFLDLPAQSRNPDPSGSILLTFGGHKFSPLLMPVLDALIQDAHILPSRITVAFSEPSDVPHINAFHPDITVLNVSKDLKKQIHNYGLVICSYGLTAFEALAAGCAVLTADPATYHARLSKNAGIPGIGHAVIRKNKLSFLKRRRLVGILKNNADITQARHRIVERFDLNRPRESLAHYLENLGTPEPRCVGCDGLFPLVIARFLTRSFYKCWRCGLIGLYRFDDAKEHYVAPYFESEYRAQYGRTYLEDFPAIYAMGLKRMKCIHRFIRKGHLLDIGCAYGPFLKAASDRGFQVYGTDISEDVVEYVQKKWAFPAAACAFPCMDFLKSFAVNEFDVVTLWYVIEHFQDLSSVLQAIASLLRPQGVLALSTPNVRGISGRRSLRRFLEMSPRDHYSIWSPQSARKLLRRHGFSVRHMRITGHHPERFPGSPQPGGLGYIVSWVLSRIFRLGDTFEIYAVREH